uniref:Ig-like domain-containing protein n=1 Tax=Meloidogyne hapla TaxID=6305 RepID=A0A1I8BSW7_MELHA
MVLKNVYSSSTNNQLSFSECLRLEQKLNNQRYSSSSRIISVIEGMPAYFHCPRLNNENDEENNLKAAWTRIRDMALLAVGASSFTADFRFQVSKPRDKHSDWVLILRRTELDDSGCYICEINTEPSSVVIPIYLKVLKLGEEQKRTEKQKLIKKQNKEYKAKLESRIEEGTILLLNCTIERIKEEDENNYFILINSTNSFFWPNIIWSKDEKLLDLENENITKYSTDINFIKNNYNTAIYTLRIKYLNSKDNGIYKCEGDRIIKSEQIIYLPLLNNSVKIKNIYFNLFIFVFILINI